MEVDNRHFIVIAHLPCLDGKAALYALQKLYPQVKMTVIPVDFRVPPNIVDANKVERIYLLDTNSHCDWLSEKYPGKVYLIDHHQGKIDYPERLSYMLWKPNDKLAACMLVLLQNPAAFSAEELEKFKYISARDTFTFENDEHKEKVMTITLAMMKGEHKDDFLNASITLDDLMKEGEVLRNIQKQKIQHLVDNSFAVTFSFPEKVEVRVTQKQPDTDFDIISEVGEQLCSTFDAPFGVIFSFDEKQQRVNLSFRSISDQNDCNSLAKRINPTGGGHKRAAGTSLTLTEWNNLIGK